MPRQNLGGRPPRLTPAKRRKALILREQGFSSKGIAERLGVSSRTIERALRTATKPAAITAEPTAPTAAPSAMRLPLLVRLRGLVAKIQRLRAGLPPDSELCARLAADSVDLGLLIARLEARARSEAGTISRDAADAAVRSTVAKFRAALAALGEQRCPACGELVEADEIQIPSVWRPTPEPASEPSSVADDELVPWINDYFDALSELAGNVTDPRAAQKYIRQAGRLGTLLARIDKSVTDSIAIDHNIARAAERMAMKRVDAILERPGPMCGPCNRAYSLHLATKDDHDDAQETPESE